MINSQLMEISLGLPVIIENFGDGMPRPCYPFTLSNLTRANLYLSSFDHKDIYKNFSDETGVSSRAMMLFFKEAFRPEDDNELNELLQAINKDNFAEIVADIKYISGIKDIDEQTNKMYDVAGEKISWNRMVNIIPLYTSTSHSEIKDLTLNQLNETIELIQRDINLKYKLATIGLTKEPSKHIDKKDSMFYEEPKSDGKTVTTMKEILGMM